MSDSPKQLTLKKWPFFLANVFFLLTGVAIFLLNEGRVSLMAVLLGIFSVGLGSVFLALPYFLEYFDQIKIRKNQAACLPKEALEAFDHLLDQGQSLNDSQAKQIAKLDRYMLIFDSLLKRMEARLHQKSNISHSFEYLQEGEKEKATNALSENFAQSTQFSPVDEFCSTVTTQESDNQSEVPTSSGVSRPSGDHSSGPSQSNSEVTTICVKATLGIGSKLFIRGEGAAELSWEKGTPMQYIALGKWSWAPKNQTTPIHFKVYIDDDVPQEQPPQTVNPGQTYNFVPHFLPVGAV